MSALRAIAVGTVAAEARIRHDRPNVAIESGSIGLGRHFPHRRDADRDQAQKLTHHSDTYTPVAAGHEKDC